MRAAVVLLALWAALPGSARAQDDPACARFQDPLRYNACLASHGPKAGAIGKAAGATGADPEAGVPAEARKALEPRTARPQGFSNVTRRHGRIHMEFRLR